MAAVLLCAALGAGYWGPAFWRALRGFSEVTWSGQQPTAAEWSLLLWPFSAFALTLFAAALLLITAQRALTWRIWQVHHDSRAARAFAPGKLSWPSALGMSLLKLALLGWVLIAPLHESAAGVLASFQRTPSELLALWGRVTLALAQRAAIALLALGAIELAVQQFERLRRLRMTRREVIDELRELAPDQRVLRELRVRTGTPIAELEQASLLLTGAGRAVALRYDAQRDAAPVLCSKAESLGALQLLARAYVLRLPLASDELLTTDLYRLEPGQPIPAAAYDRVAKLLAAELRGKS